MSPRPISYVTAEGGYQAKTTDIYDLLKDGGIPAGDITERIVLRLHGHACQKGRPRHLRALLRRRGRLPYEIRRSSIAKKKSIVVTPNNVEVIAPDDADESAVLGFVEAKRRWVFTKLTEMNERLAFLERHTYHRLQSGAKIRFRGRNAAITIRAVEQPDFEIKFNGGFDIAAPKHLSGDELEAALGREMILWFKSYLKTDVEGLRRRYERLTGLSAAGSIITHSDTLWGSLTRSGVIKINWHLIEAPKAVLEYVVLHELCHTAHRNHTPAFWGLIGQHMPDYQIRKRWLENLMPSFKL